MNKPEDTTTVDLDQDLLMKTMQETIKAEMHARMITEYGRKVGNAWMHRYQPEELLAGLTKLAEFINAQHWDGHFVTILCASVMAQNATARHSVAPEVRDTWDGYQGGVEINSSAAGYILSVQTLGYMAMQPDAPQEVKDHAAANGQMVGHFDPEAADASKH